MKRPTARVTKAALSAMALAVAVCVTALPQTSMAQSPAGLTYDPQRGVFSFATGLDHALPAVVKVTTLGGERRSSADGPKALQGGSGVIVDAANGIVITNHHVIDGGRKYTVDLIDGRLFDAVLIGSDKATDIAVLQITPDNLTQVETVDSDTLRSGDLAFAVGYPLGLDQTLTMGVISGLNRSGLGDAIEDYIQTDAAVNSGNSGGPLLDSRGRLIGINTAVLSGGFGGGNDGIAFAVPSRIMLFVADQIRSNGEVSRGQAGVTVGSLTAARARELDLNIVRGAVVHDVAPGSAAERAGLQRNDVITSLQGRPVSNGGAVQAAIGVAPAGTTMPVSYLRGGREYTGNLTVDRAGTGGVKLGHSQAMARGLTVQPSQQGIQVAVVDSGSFAADAGVKAGDIIRSINGRTVSDLSGFSAAASGNGALGIQVLRGRESLNFNLPR